eukprot:2896051-Prymnesium_polylepis.1
MPDKRCPPSQADTCERWACFRPVVAELPKIAKHSILGGALSIGLFTGTASVDEQRALEKA